MDEAISSVLQARQGALATQIQTSVVKKSLDATQVQGDAVNQMLQAAAQLSKALGKGEGLDCVG